MKMAEREQSEFNDSIGLLKRINIQLFYCWKARTEKNILVWFDALNSLSLELCNYIKKEEMAAFEVFIRENQTKIMTIAGQNAKSGNNQIPFELFMALRTWEIKLRNVYNESGLESKKKDNEWDDEGEW